MGRVLQRWRWSLLLALVLALGLVWVFWPAAIPVDSARVTRGSMSVGVTDDGVTRAQEQYFVSAPVTGYLARVALKPGDEVVKGQEVTRITGRPSSPLDPRTTSESQAALAAARAASRQAAASLQLARNDLARAEALAAQGFLPLAQLDAARNRVATGQAALAQANAEIARIRAVLTQPAGASHVPVSVRAPAPGRVLTVISESEGVVAEGTPIMTIGDPAHLEVVVDLLSREAVQIKPGDRAEITRWGGPQPLVGQVYRIEPFGRLRVSALGVEEQRVNVIIRFANPALLAQKGLGHGFQVDATIRNWGSENALRVPVGALFRDSGGNWQVYVIEGGRARVRTVRIGHVNDTFGEVLGGLSEGEQVVLNPANALQDGLRVTVREGAAR